MLIERPQNLSRWQEPSQRIKKKKPSKNHNREVARP